jgi:hypothetical protein
MRAQNRFALLLIPLYSRRMSERPLSLLQMSALRRLALAAVGCAVVWIAVAVALA